MRIKNAFRVMSGNAIVIYKAIFFRLIVVSVIGVIGFFSLRDVLKSILTAPESKNLWNAFVSLFLDPIKGQKIDGNKLSEAFEAFRTMLKGQTAILNIAFIGTVALIIIYNIIIKMGDYGFAYLYTQFMSAQSHYGLCSTLILHFGKAFLYAIIMVPITLLYDGLILSASIFAVVSGVRYLSVFAVILTLIFMVFAFSFKYTVLSHFLPRIVVENESVGGALLKLFSGRFDFKNLLGSYSFMVMIAYYVNISACIFTLGAGLFVTLPITALFNLLIAIVDFYNSSGKKFYVDRETVIAPEILNENKDLMKYM